MKRCSSCLVEKPESEFSKNRSRSDGLAHYCKECANAALRQWRENNRDTWREGKRRNYRNNVEREQERARQRRLSNPHPLQRHNCEYHRVNPDRRPAVNAVNRAVLRGEMPPVASLQCQSCGNPAEEYHHHSYEQQHWLDVTPLCRSCHRLLHTEMSRKESV